MRKARIYEVSPHFFLTYNAPYITIGYNMGWQPVHYSVVIESDYH